MKLPNQQEFNKKLLEEVDKTKQKVLESNEGVSETEAYLAAVVITLGAEIHSLAEYVVGDDPYGGVYDRLFTKKEEK